MHERFFGLAEVLCFCLAWTCRGRFIPIAGLMQIGFLLAGAGVVANSNLAFAIAFVAETIAIAMLFAERAASFPSSIEPQSRCAAERA
jgi:hypothetical protein